MSRTTLTRFSLALPVTLLMSQGAFADVSAAQVWGDWKQYMESFGYEITAEETTSGDDVTVNELSMSMLIPDEAGKMTMTMGPLTFAQNGTDVDIIMPADMPLTFSGTPTAAGKPPMKMTFNYKQTGHTLKVSGAPEEMTYDYVAASVALTLQELLADGETYGPENAKVDVTITGINSTTTMKVGEMRSYSQSGAIEALDYDINIDNPQEPVKVMLVGGTTGITFDGSGDIPTNVADASDMAAMIKAGFAIAGTFNYGAGTTQMNVTDPANGDFSATTSSDGGNLGVNMGATALGYTGEQNNLKMSVKVANLPFPVDLSMVKGAFNLGMPLAASEEPQDFVFGLTLGDFVMSDLIWSIFDPTSQLPRDPATVEVGLTGKAKLLIDIMDPEAAAGADVPGELQTLTVNNILVDAVGAKLEGSGDFTFDNTDTTTFPGMPKPVGAVNLALAGGNGLMDKLVAMGLLPEEQAMGARMMMGLFAVPGDAPDTLKSTVEFTQDGQVLANGQRIK